jgi:hypothetical protein
MLLLNMPSIQVSSSLESACALPRTHHSHAFPSKHALILCLQPSMCTTTNGKIGERQSTSPRYAATLRDLRLAENLPHKSFNTHSSPSPLGDVENPHTLVDTLSNSRQSAKGEPAQSYLYWLQGFLILPIFSQLSFLAPD